MATVTPSASTASAWASYQRMRVRLAGLISRELSEKTGLSEADCEVLLALAESQEVVVRDLELRCGLDWEKSRLSHQLRRMEQRGLVVRETCSEDGRGSMVALTKKGRTAAELGKQVQDGAVDRYVARVLTTEQFQQLGLIAQAILVATAEQPSPPPSHPA